MSILRLESEKGITLALANMIPFEACYPDVRPIHSPTMSQTSSTASASPSAERFVRDWDAPPRGDEVSLRGPKIGCAELEAEFFEALDDDLNTAKALAVIWKVVDSDYPTAAKAESILKMDEILGLGLKAFVNTPLEIPSEIKELVLQREHARDQKNWGRADKIRRDLEEKGWTVEDAPEGPKARQLK